MESRKPVTGALAGIIESTGENSCNAGKWVVPVAALSMVFTDFDARRSTGLFQTAVELCKHHADSFRKRRQFIMQGTINQADIAGQEQLVFQLSAGTPSDADEAPVFVFSEAIRPFDKIHAD